MAIEPGVSAAARHCEFKMTSEDGQPRFLATFTTISSNRKPRALVGSPQGPVAPSSASLLALGQLPPTGKLLLRNVNNISPFEFPSVSSVSSVTTKKF